MVVLNKNIHEFDYLENNSLKSKIISFFQRETKEDKIERLETENRMSRLRYTKLNKRYKNVVAENKILKKELSKYENK